MSDSREEYTMDESSRVCRSELMLCLRGERGERRDERRKRGE